MDITPVLPPVRQSKVAPSASSRRSEEVIKQAKDPETAAHFYERRKNPDRRRTAKVPFLDSRSGGDRRKSARTVQLSIKI